MATKRMFSKHIVDSDAFLEMPLSTQALYFHLNMRADDDGFVGNPKRVMRMIGANEDEFKVLLAKKFILEFEHQSVCVIKHWLVHNTLRKDTYKATLYDDLMSKLSTKNNNIYTLGNLPLTESQLTVNADKVREGKVSKGKVRLDKKRKDQQVDDGFNLFWNAYPKKVGKGKAIESWQKYKPDLDTVLKTLQWQIHSDQWVKENGAFIPNPATYINQQRWEDEKQLTRIERLANAI